MTLSPRSYGVDPTGRQFVLDPDPLLDVAARGFAMQQETMRQVAEVGKEGIKTAEFIAARQQLGRVKAQLGELDVNDPLFSQKYSAVVSSNPLAFTNEKIAPVTKAAVTPVLSAASSAMEQRAALERAQVMAGQRMDAAGAAYQNRINYWDYQRQNPRPTAPRRVTAGEQLLFGGGVSQTQPQAPMSPDVPTQTQSPTGPGSETYGPDLLTEPSDAYGGGLIPFGPEGPYDAQPAAPTFEGQDLTEGEGDGGISMSNGVLGTPTGQWQVSSVTGDGVTAKPVVVPNAPMQVPPGKRAIPDAFNPDGSIASYKLEDTPVQSDAQMKATLDALVESDPLVASATGRASVLKAKFEGLKEASSLAPPAEKEKFAPMLAEAAIEAAGQAAVAKTTAEQARLRYMAQNNPQAAANLAAREMSRAINDLPFYGPTQDDLTATPPPAPNQPAAPLPPARPTAAQVVQQRQAANNPQNATWTKEKTFALDEAKRVAKAAGFDENALLDAVASNDVRSIQAVLGEAQRNGVRSDLLTVRGAPGLNAYGATSNNVYALGESKELGRPWIDVLRVAVKERGPTQGGGQGYTWRRKN